MSTVHAGGGTQYNDAAVHTGSGAQNNYYGDVDGTQCTLEDHRLRREGAALRAQWLKEVRQRFVHPPGHDEEALGERLERASFTRHRVPVQRRGPETGERCRVAAVDDEVTDPGHDGLLGV